MVDYADPVAAAKQTRKAAPNLEHAGVCIGEESSTTIVAASLNGKGTIAQITLHPIPVEDVRTVSSDNHRKGAYILPRSVCVLLVPYAPCFDNLTVDLSHRIGSRVNRS